MYLYRFADYWCCCCAAAVVVFAVDLHPRWSDSAPIIFRESCLSLIVWSFMSLLGSQLWHYQLQKFLNASYVSMTGTKLATISQLNRGVSTLKRLKIEQKKASWENRPNWINLINETNSKLIGAQFSNASQFFLAELVHPMSFFPWYICLKASQRNPFHQVSYEMKFY